MNQFFRCFCINRFGVGLLHYLLSYSDFGFEFSEIFDYSYSKIDSITRWVGESTRLPIDTIFVQPLNKSMVIVHHIPSFWKLTHWRLKNLFHKKIGSRSDPHWSQSRSGFKEVAFAVGSMSSPLLWVPRLQTIQKDFKGNASLLGLATTKRSNFLRR